MSHNYPKDLPQNYTSYQGMATKELQEELKTFNLVDVNGGLWYGVPIFTFWRVQVDNGSMPEPDMDHNYIGLYKNP